MDNPWGSQFAARSRSGFSQPSNDSYGEPVRRHGSMLGILPSRQKMREQMQADQKPPARTISKKFKTNGFSQWMARNQRFEQVTLLMISLNAIWIAVDTDWNQASVLLDAQPHFQVAEHMFCSYFLYEWTVRFLAFAEKTYALRDAWFVFDSLLVSTMVLETWVMSVVVLCTGSSGSNGLGNASLLRVARLLRLTRMARMARLLRATPELLILIKGMIASVRSVVVTLGLLLVIIYIFAIAFTQICAGSECEVLFPGVATAMHTLFLNGALMNDLGSLTTTLEQHNLGLLLLLYIYVLLAALTLMNMLLGVICSVVWEVAESERESITLEHVNEQFKELFSQISDADLDGDDNISKAEFLKLLADRSARHILSVVGVDVMSLVDLADTIFDVEQEDSGAGNGFDDQHGKNTSGCLNRPVKVDFSTLMQHILNLRGTNQASFKQIVELRKFIKSQFAQLDSKVCELEAAQHKSRRFQNQLKTQNTPRQGATRRRRTQSRSLSPESVVPRRMAQGQSASPSSISAVEARIAPHCHSMREDFELEEAAITFQQSMAESLDNLLAVYQCKMVACEAQVVHGQQQQQQQGDQQRHIIEPASRDRLRGNVIPQHQELEKALPGLEAARVISIPGVCNAKDEEPSSISPALLNEGRGRTGRIVRESTDARPISRHTLECQQLPGSKKF